MSCFENVLKKMEKTDSGQRWSEMGAGTKGKTIKEEEKQPSLIQRVETMASVTELLLETLADLSDRELHIFKDVFRGFHIHCHKSPEMLSLQRADKQNVVFLMVQTYGQMSVEKISRILRKMSRTDLVQRLSDSNSGPKKKLPVDEHLSALIHKVATVAAVKDLLLETLNDLSHKEQESFKWFLQFSLFQRSRPYISWRQLQRVYSRSDMVDVVVDMCGQQSVEVMKEVLMDMNRTDLVQRLSEVSPGSKVVIKCVAAAGSSAEASVVNTEEGEKQSLDERWPALKQKVETMASVTELLLETLADLSDRELRIFKDVLLRFHIRHQDSVIPVMLPWETSEDIVFLMVQTYGQKSVEKTKEILKKMSRTDLVQRLSDSNSGPQKKLPVDEHLSALIHKVATLRAVKDLLLETLNDLSHKEQESFKWFLQFRFFQRSRPQISWRQLQRVDSGSNMVDVVVDMCGQQSVEVMKEVLMDMKRTDLVQRLSELCPGSKVVIKCVAAAGSSAEESGVNTEEGEKQSLDERWPALKQKVETMASVTELLLETLKDAATLSFRDALLFQTDLYRYFPNLPSFLLKKRDVQDMMFIMVLMYGQQSVEMINQVLKKLNKTDLVQKLSDSSSGLQRKKESSAGERHSALIQRVATIAAVKEVLLETLNNLSIEELKKFKDLLRSIASHKDLPNMLPSYMTDRAKVAFLMVQTYGQQSVWLTREVIMEMKLPALVQRLAMPSSGFQEKTSVGEHRAAPSESTKAAVKKILLKTLSDLSHKGLEKFKWLLQFAYFQRSLPQIPLSLLCSADRADLLVDLMVENQQAVEVTKEVLMDMNRTDLVQRLSESSPRPKGSLEPEACGRVKDSSDWTKLEPEVSSTGADETPTYSLQSEAGRFECSVSGLRWVCEAKISFKYQFCSWEEPMERMESLRYMPAGPLMDITVTTGKLDEVYLPHWIFIEDDPKISDKFAVLHIDDCGDVVEKVSEVTASYVKLSEPVFSPEAVLIKAGFPVKISCNVLIYYKPNTPFLKLHVFLIPHDHHLQQTVDKKKSSEGYHKIQKPRPDKYLKMQHRFSLTADKASAKILPEKMILRYDSQDPNFYEVFIKNPDTEFHFTLLHTNSGEPVWTCEIRRDDYQTAVHLEEDSHSVDEILTVPIQNATITTDKEKILKTLGDLKQDEVKGFKWFLQDINIMAGFPHIPRSRLEGGDIYDLVDLVLQTYNQQSVEVTKTLLKKINRNDLVQML
uniref:uncharacterized protein LOC124064998 isoform X3 n=1 Tax=Scatophagus argus TaxID=75038 RepID=UPI001ED80F8E|nr:uncharacterized protein LOC124064998 isoform X3 [Scatophagus argus]